MAANVMNNMPAPPDGFSLDGDQSTTPALPDGFQLDQPTPPRAEPNMGAANRAFSHVLGDSLSQMGEGAMKTVKDIGSVYAPIEAALNAGSGLLLGFPAYIGGAIGGLADKYLLGQDVDPKEMADTMQKVFTYQPLTEAGQRLSGNVLMPLEKLNQGADELGYHAVDLATKLHASDSVAAAAGAVTSASIQMLTPTLLGELGRKMGGAKISGEDMKNVATEVAGPKANPAQVEAAENSLHAVYEQTGISPFTVAEDARANPDIRSDLVDPKVEIPKDYEQYLEKPAPQAEPLPGDGLPLLDLENPANKISESADDVNNPEAVDATKSESSPTDQVNSRSSAVEDIDKTSSESPHDGIVEMNAGINPVSSIKAFADSYTPFVGVEKPEISKAPNIAGQAKGYNPSPLGDALRKIFAPASRGAIAEETAGIMRSNFGVMARDQELAVEKLKGIAAKFDKMSVEDNVQFIDAMERGQPLSNPELQAAADNLRQLLDQKRDEVQSLGKGKLENFDENYFPHIWKQEAEAASLFSRRPLEGNKNFLKERTIPFTTDGLRWRTYDSDGDFVQSYDKEADAKANMLQDGRIGEPLTPITSNPVELALLKAREMDRYIYGQNIFEEMKSAGFARFVRFGARAPDGWTKINDKIAKVLTPSDEGGMILRGEYYGPDEAATLLNNHLSPGLQGNTFFDAWRGIGTALNSAQLGLSLFHVGFTTMDSMISKVALGVKQIGRGDIGEGIGSVAQGLNPAQPFMNIYKGDRLLRAYLGKLDSPEMAPIVDALMRAGGKVKMDDFYRNEAVNTFKQAIRNSDTWGAAKAFLPTILDRINAPIMEQLVPRQKLGVFFDLAKDWLEKNPDAKVAESRAGLGKLWDSVDNRMGQLVYDNVFWNRALKDGLMATVRSVGWNLGTFRELVGGLLDIKDIARGKPMSDRTAYLIALPLTTAIYGAILGYAYTGNAPESLKDCFYPKTGQLRPDGSEDRVSTPTYMKDVYAYGEDITNFAKYGSDPTQTLKNKANPLISVVSQMLNNKDYFGGAIRNPADTAVRQIADEAEFIGQQLEPFSIRNYQQQLQAKNEKGSLSGYLTSPSMIGIAPAPGYITKSPEQQESAEVSALHDPLMKKFKQEIKNGADVDQTIHRMISAGFTRKDIIYAIKSASVQLPHRLKQFSNDEEASQQ